MAQVTTPKVLFSDLKIPTGYVLLGIFLVIAIIVIVITKSLKGKAKEIAQGAISKDTIKELSNTYVKTFSEVEYRNFADSLHEKLERGALSDDDEAGALQIILKMQNELDVQSLISAYGVRESKIWDVFTFANEKRGLLEMLRDEMSSEAKEINSVWSSRGISTLI